METCLSDGCTVGVFGDSHNWACTLEAYRRGIVSQGRSAAEAGNLGVLLMLAGRRERALEVFNMLADMARAPPASSDQPVRVSPDDDYVGQRDASDGSGNFGLQNDNCGPHLLAALVLSGEWARAHRCCERMVLGGVSGSNGVVKEPSFFSFY